MVEGGSSRDFRRVKTWAYSDPSGFAALIDLITTTTIDYLSGQIAAGADAVQLRWNPAVGSNVGELVVPDRTLPGQYKLTVTAEDIAHNIGSQEVSIEILP